MPKRYAEYESMSKSLLTSSTAGIDGPILRRDRVWVQSFHIKHVRGILLADFSSLKAGGITPPIRLVIEGRGAETTPIADVCLGIDASRH